jgi:hypothetical protein
MKLPEARTMKVPKVTRTTAAMSASPLVTNNRPTRAWIGLTMATLLDHALVNPPSAPYGEPTLASSEQPRDRSITLRHPADADGFVDGGWWPPSLDLIAELPALLVAVEAAGYGEIRRVSYALTGWDGQPPRRSTMLNRVVKLGGFRSQSPAEISLIDSSERKRIILVVVPPGTDPPVARRALSTAGRNGDRHRAREILDLAHRPAPAHPVESGCINEFAAAGWDSEGGRVVP